jgi:hypothetical protein
MDSELGGKFWMDPYPSLSLCYFTYLCYILHFGPPRTIYLHSTICTNKYSLVVPLRWRKPLYHAQT